MRSARECSFMLSHAHSAGRTRCACSWHDERIVEQDDTLRERRRGDAVIHVGTCSHLVSSHPLVHALQAPPPDDTQIDLRQSLETHTRRQGTLTKLCFGIDVLYAPRELK